MRHGFFLLALILILNACASSPRKRFMIGASAGAVTGAVAGFSLSPNDESRGMNALVFGLSGSLLSGLIGLFAFDQSEVPVSQSNIKDVGSDHLNEKTSIHLEETKLPDFVKDRFKPVVIESFTQPDQLEEDGSLHEPHKVYRIKRQAELISKPLKNDQKNELNGSNP